MDRARVLNEVAALSDAGASVAYDLDVGGVWLAEFAFPAGWAPGAGAVRFDLPPSYPKTQPKVFIEERMRFHGGRPMTMHRTGPDGWSRYCIHDLSNWDPARHTLVTMIRLLTESLNDPTSANPVRNAP